MVVQLTRFSDGKRRVTYITEITGKEGIEAHVRDIFRFHQMSVDEQGRSVGFFSAQDYVPKFQDEFKLKGLNVPLTMYESEETKKKKGQAPPKK